MRRTLVTTLALLVSMGACGSGSDDEATTTTEEATTTTVKRTTTTVDRCAVATEDSIKAMGVLLDRVDSNFQELDSAAVNELFGKIGGDVGAACGSTGAGDSMSEILVYLSEQSAVRSTVTSAYIEGMIGSLCDLDLELTTAGQVVCTTN